MKKKTLYACVSSVVIMALSAYTVASIGKTDKRENLLPSVSVSVSEETSVTSTVHQSYTAMPVDTVVSGTVGTFIKFTGKPYTQSAPVISEVTSVTVTEVTSPVSETSQADETSSVSETYVTEAETAGSTSDTEYSVTETEYTEEDSFQNVMLSLVNEARRGAGVSELAGSTVLDEAADIRASEISIIFGHTRPDERSWFSVYEEAGMFPEHTGENIASGMTDAHEAFEAWYDSPSHREVMLDPGFTMLGTGIYKTGRETYWVQIFAG